MEILKVSSTSHYLIELLDIVVQGLDTPRTLPQIVLMAFKKGI